MAGYIFRSRRRFTREELVGLEGVYVEDLDPPAAVTGIGSGNVCLVGEFDDGPLAVLTEIDGGDLSRQFGGLGYTYAGVTANNPCARKRSGEVWNGNGFLYSRFIKAPRFMVARVDSSVGEVAFSPRAITKGSAGPIAPAAGDTLSLTTSTGGPTASTAIAAAEASSVGSAPIVSTGFLGGEQITITLDQGSAPIPVIFGSGDQTATAVVTRINNTVGAIVASQSSGTLTVKGLIKGTSGRVVLANVTPGALAALFLTAGSNSGTGNVGNLASVTVAEVAAIINGTAGLTTINAKALISDDGTLAVYDSSSSSGTIAVTAGNLATLLKLTTGVTVKAGEHSGGVIKAGTRVRTAGGLEWVVMVSTTIPAGTNAAPNIGPHLLKVRPAYDDGTAVGTGATTVTTLVDQPTWATFAVNNPQALTAALTEGQLDAQYIAALDATKGADGIAVDINYQYSARRSYAVDVYAAALVETASNTGLAGRKYIRSGALGITKAQAKTDRALIATDRVWYTWPGWQVTIPEILRRGVSGGLGFADDGNVTLRSPGPLVSISAQLAPEENPGQQTNLIDQFFAVENLGYSLTSDDYRDLKASGICAPRRDPTAGSIYQSGVTTDLNKNRSTQARRKMADFVQDTVARACVKHSKKLSTEARKDAVIADIDSFLAGLLQDERIEAYVLDESANTDATEGDGGYIVITRVRTQSSMDWIKIQTEIGPGVVIIDEAA